jgi:voltage-gated potassium channel
MNQNNITQYLGQLVPAHLKKWFGRYSLLVLPLLIMLLSYILGLIFIFPFERETFKTVLDYTWFYYVTATTTGYGDLFPKTDIGRIMAMIINFNINYIASVLLFASIVSIINDIATQAKRGLKIYKKMKNQIVLLGYRPEFQHTDKIIKALLEDDRVNIIVVVTDKIEEAPLRGHLKSEKIKFIIGSPMDATALENAGVKNALKVIVDGNTDAETLMMCSFLRSIDKDVRVVVEIDDVKNAVLFENIAGSKITPVPNLQHQMAVTELLDADSIEVIVQLCSQGGQDIFTADVPANIKTTFEVLARELSKRGMILLGLVNQVNPPHNTPIISGNRISVIGQTHSINWSQLKLS